MATRVIGKSVPRKEGREKVTGRAKYVDDLKFPGMIFGATVRSPVARGRILGIHFEPGHSVGRIYDRHRKGYSRQELHRSAHRRSALPG